MTKTIQSYFQKEKQLLDEALQQFAQKHQGQASIMNIDPRRCYDPHVERLLEGSAYLQAITQQQIELGIHHISEALLRRLAPQYLAPRPAKTMVEFSAEPHMLFEQKSIEKGIMLTSSPVGEEQTRCQFQTEQELIIQPIQLVRIESNVSQLDRLLIHLSFQVNDGVQPKSLNLSPLSLFINDHPTSASQWYDLLTTQVCDIWLKQPHVDPQYLGTQMHMKPGYTNTTGQPNGVRSLTQGFGLLEDYFHFPERFKFVNIHCPIPVTTETFDLMIVCKAPDYSIRAHPQLLKLHCVPAVNMFIADCEPISFYKSRSEYTLISCQSRTNSMNILDVERVLGVKKHEREPIVLQNFHQHQYEENKDAIFFRLKQDIDKQHFTRHRLVFSGNTPEAMQVSSEALVYNGHYPRQFISPKMLFLQDNQVSLGLKATNLYKPSQVLIPAFDAHYAVSVLSVLNSRWNDLANVGYLKTLLKQHDWMKAGYSQIDAILHTNLQQFQKFSHGLLVRGMKYELTIMEEAFPTVADLNLFGCILHNILKLFVPFNMKLDMHILCLPSERCITWSALHA